MKPTTKPKIKDFFNPITNPAGGFTPSLSNIRNSKLTPATGSQLNSRIMGATANSTPAVGNLSALDKKEENRKLTSAYAGDRLWMEPRTTQPASSGIVMPQMPAPGGMSRLPEPGQSVPPAYQPPATGGKGGFGTAAPTTVPISSGFSPVNQPATEQAQVPPQYLKPDGTMKTPEEVAAEIANSLKMAGGAPDVGRLAVDQFNTGKTAEELQVDTARINNIRNDIAVGESDPFKIASASGIAYTPEELRAIEQAYAGVYDPALDTAMTKLEQRRLEDQNKAERDARLEEIKLTAQLNAEADRNQQFTLSPDEVRYDAQGNVIASGGSSGGGDLGFMYTPGSNPTVDSYVKGIQDGVLKPSDVPGEYMNLVAQGLAAGGGGGDTNQNKFVRTQAQEALTNIGTALDYLEGRQGGTINTADNALQRSIFGFIPGTDAKNLEAVVTTVKALIGFDALQKMRENSPTGGALGNITEKELGYLQSVQGSLDLNQGTEQLVNTLKRIQQSFDTLNIINSPDGTPFERDGEMFIKFGDQMIPESEFKATSMTPPGTGNRPQRNNNPLNIKASEFTQQYPGVVGIDPSPATDGGNFLTFATPEAGFQAAQRLLQNPNYQSLSVDAAMRRWSNNGYGDEILPSLRGRAMASLAPAELASLVQEMARIEGYYA
jgi:hypothetical protein